MWTDPKTQIDYMTLEAFTLPAHRRKGYVKLGSSALNNDNWMFMIEKVAVFSDDMLAVAKGAGFTDVTQFFKDDEGRWLPCPVV
jgi:hypothetical protein